MAEMPTNLLERAIQRAGSGQLGMQSVLWTLAASTVYAPSGADPGPDRGGFQPVLFAKGETQMVAVYTSPDRAASVGDIAPFVVAFAGEELLRLIPAVNGLVVNPATTVGFDLPPEGIAAIRQEISA